MCIKATINNQEGVLVHDENVSFELNSIVVPLSLLIR